LKWILALIIFLPLLTVYADEKCLQSDDIKNSYGTKKMQFVSHSGNLVAINTAQFDKNNGYAIDIYASTQIAVKTKGSTQIAFYKTCLIPIEKQLKGRYIYGTLSKQSVEIKTAQATKRIAFVK
jgi:S1-C subfamily serine protease